MYKKEYLFKKEFLTYSSLKKKKLNIYYFIKSNLFYYLVFREKSVTIITLSGRERERRLLFILLREYFFSTWSKRERDGDRTKTNESERKRIKPSRPLCY